MAGKQLLITIVPRHSWQDKKTFETGEKKRSHAIEKLYSFPVVSRHNFSIKTKQIDEFAILVLTLKLSWEA